MTGAITWLATYVEADDVLFRIGRSGEQLVAEWIGLVTVTSDAHARTVTFGVAPGADADDVEKIRRGGAMLLVRHLQGKLALHGAAVALGDGAVVLLGRSGQGKSTLAASLCAAGAALLADDAVAIDAGVGENTFVVQPTEARHWLDGAALAATAGASDGHGPASSTAPAAGGKSAHPAPRTASGPVPLRAFVELAFVDGLDAPRLVRLAPGVAAMATLVPQAVRFAVDDAALQRRELDALGALVESVPVYRLERARSMDGIARAHPLLESLTASRGEGGMSAAP